MRGSVSVRCGLVFTERPYPWDYGYLYHDAIANSLAGAAAHVICTPPLWNSLLACASTVVHNILTFKSRPSSTNMDYLTLTFLSKGRRCWVHCAVLNLDLLEKGCQTLGLLATFALKWDSSITKGHLIHSSNQSYCLESQECLIFCLRVILSISQ